MASAINFETGLSTTDSDTESDTFFDGPEVDVNASSRLRRQFKIGTESSITFWKPEDDDMDWDQQLKISVENDKDFDYKGHTECNSAGTSTNPPVTEPCSTDEVDANSKTIGQPARSPQPQIADTIATTIPPEANTTNGTTKLEVQKIEHLKTESSTLKPVIKFVEFEDPIFFQHTMTFDFPAVKIEAVDGDAAGDIFEVDTEVMEVDPNPTEELITEGASSTMPEVDSSHDVFELASCGNHFLLSHDGEVGEMESSTVPSSNSNVSSSSAASSEPVASGSSSLYLSEGSQPMRPVKSPFSDSFTHEDAVALLTTATSSSVLTFLSSQERQDFANRLIGTASTGTSAFRAADDNQTEGNNISDTREYSTLEEEQKIIQCLKRIQGGPRCLFECNTFTELMSHRSELHNDLPAVTEFEVNRGSLRSQSMLLCLKHNAFDKQCRRLCADQMDLVLHGVRQIHKKEVHFLRTFCFTCNTAFGNREAALLHMLRYKDTCGASR